jgi:hypothetical protein
VKLSRIRTGERLMLGGAVALVVIPSLDWFFLSTPDARLGQHESGWRSLGWPITLLLVVAIGTSLAAVLTTAAQRAPAWPIVLTVFAFVFSALGTLAIAVRLVAQPGLGVDAGNADVDLEPAAFAGLAAAAIMAAGAWIGMVDERTDAPEAIEQTEEVLRVRGAPRPAPPRDASAARTQPKPSDALADPPGA